MKHSWHDARTASFAATHPLPAEIVPLGDTVDRVLAVDARAKQAVPHFSSSAMDGWAVAGDAPWRIVADAAARPGSEPGVLGAGEAIPVVTGGRPPQGTRGVLRSENAEVRDGWLSVAESGAPNEPFEGQHIRHPGEEASEGEVVVRAGTLLNPAHVALLAGCGYDTIEVIARPRVSLLFTGSEVVVSGIPAPGTVRDSFGPQLPAFAALLGASTSQTQRIGDDFAATKAALLVDPDASDVILTTGGTGLSAVDHLRSALREIGAEILIEGVAMRPGGPTLLARLPDGRFAVGLPGNPLAAMMGVLTVVQPLLAALAGTALPTLSIATVGSAATGRAGTTILAPFRISAGRAEPNPWTGSGMMRGLADAAGVMVVPPEGVREGEPATVLPLPWARADRAWQWSSLLHAEQVDHKNQGATG